MAKNFPRTGKKVRPKTAVKGKRYHCAIVPQTKSEAGQDARSVVLPELPQGKGSLGPMKILFLHGWQSVPGGVKPTYLNAARPRGHQPGSSMTTTSPQAVRIAQAEFDKHQPQVVVGSSRGGAVAMNINSGDAKLVLLCPAWKKFGTAKTVKPGTVILHSRADDVIPFADCEELAKNSGATLIEVGTDHRLADPEPLEAMLRACEGANLK